MGCWRLAFAIGHRLGGIMSNSLKQVEHYRGLAEEFRRLAAFSFSSQMQNHYFEMAEHYNALAEAEDHKPTGPL